MKKDSPPPFKLFAKHFVRVYWQTVKEQKFPMPPDEPVEETFDELLSAISVDITDSVGSQAISMTSKHGDWWRFTFRATKGNWAIISSHAKSLNPSIPHDLIAPPLDLHFRPFLDYVIQTANRPSH